MNFAIAKTKGRVAAIAVAAAAAIGAAAPGDAEAAYRSFESPTGNIACAYDSDSYADPVLSCDLHSAGINYTMTPWTSPSYWDSQGLSGSRILRYGQTFRAGGFRCRSSYEGMKCWSRYTGDGFFLSRDDWYRF